MTIHPPRTMAVLLVMLLLCLSLSAMAEGEWPQLNDDGFLDEGEFVYENADEGVWRYCSSTLKVEILRYTETGKVPLIWYEAEVWSCGETFGMITATEGEHFRTTDWPTNVCTRNGAVLAINGDYACGRWSNMRYAKERYKVGILLRDGEICSEETRPYSATSKTFPNLDTLALLPDGDMRVYNSDELTAEDYVAMGAVDVLAFGPWLIRDGVMNDNLARFGTTRAPRTAIGMVEKGHYFAMMVEGRHRDSKGGDLSFLAEKLLARGCVTGFNLDGGETSCILFMGKQINKVGSSHSGLGYARKGAEFLAIGTSALVEGYTPAGE